MEQAGRVTVAVWTCGGPASSPFVLGGADSMKKGLGQASTFTCWPCQLCSPGHLRGCPSPLPMCLSIVTPRSPCLVHT